MGDTRGMDSSWILWLIGTLFLVLVVSMIVTGLKYRQQVVPDYRALFVLGIAFLALGVTGNWGISAVGVVFLLAGIKHRDKWGKHTRWADYPPELQKMKVFFASAMVILVLAAAAYAFAFR